MDPEIVKRLDALGEKLGATGEYLWNALVRGCFAAGLMYGCAFIVAAVLGLCGSAYAKKEQAKVKPGSDLQDFLRFAAVVLLIASVGCVFGSCSYFVDAIAPERAAIKIIFGK